MMQTDRPAAAVINGLTGPDSAVPSELLLDKGYEVTGIMRRPTCSTPIASITYTGTRALVTNASNRTTAN